MHAVASATGYSFQIAPRPLDQVGVDATITAVGAQGSRSLPQLHVQVKCTSINVLTNDCIRYPLKVKNYEELSDDSRVIPLILVVVLVPDNINDWLQQSEAELCLKRCGYWVSLQGEPAIQNRTSVTVQLPRENLFTLDALRGIMQRIGAGEPL